MAKRIYCWRCKTDMPMLDEQEWPTMAQLLSDFDQREKALAHYFEVTGIRETNVNAIWHHRIKLYGSPCPDCHKPLRTPQARFYPACGFTKPTDPVTVANYT